MMRTHSFSFNQTGLNIERVWVEKMKLFFTFIACCCIFWILESNAKYLISANDSVNVQNCDLETVKNISLLNANPEEIIIHNCHINELPNALFIRFQKLRILEITESQLLTISDYAFNGLNALQLLNLSRNNLTTVKTWSNENLKELHLLDLRRNAISSIHRNAFERFSNLLKLNLAVNHISEIPDELFRSVPALKYLNLGKNELKSIDSHTFKHLHKLIHLELRHNQIEFIEADSFVGCTHLKVLHLQVRLKDIRYRYWLATIHSSFMQKTLKLKRLFKVLIKISKHFIFINFQGKSNKFVPWRTNFKYAETSSPKFVTQCTWEV